MRVLVTGASGFIGGKICDRLSQLGIEFTCCGRRQSSRNHYFRCDLAEPLTAVPMAVDAVIHCAARSSPWGSRTQFNRDNVIATQSIVEYCRQNGFPKLVFISSSSVYYRNCDQFDITEQTPQAKYPINRYAATKQISEQVVRSYEGPWVIARPRAVFGPGDTVLLPRILKAARAGRLPILTRNESPVVGDLIYIDNLVDYILASTTNANVTGEFNLTNNQPVAINEFLLGIFRQLGLPEPKRKLSVRTAMLAATALEYFQRCFAPKDEPAITRFGVHVFAYSKTFDVSKSLEQLGKPRVSIDQGVQWTVAELLESTRSLEADSQLQ